jgi:iron complex outermembrane receptor protein
MVGLVAMGAVSLEARAESVASDQSNPDIQPVEAGEPSAQGVREKPQGIEEITVTARKREENLQDTPVAVTAFSADEIVDRDIRQIDQIQATVPSLQFDSAVGSSNAARVYLRGVGNGDPISSDDPGVGLYVDGVFQPRAQGALLTISDIERVEVLRGPQGTLFGKNTIGGAISVTTAKPDPTEFAGQGSVRFGNYNRFDSRLSVNVPVVAERVAARFSFASATRDAFVTNVSTGRDFQDDKLLGGRAQLRFTPIDEFELDLGFDQSKENRAPFGGKCVVVNRRSPATGAEPNGVDSDGDGRVESAPSAVAFASLVGLPLGQQVPVAQAGFPAELNNFYAACAQDANRSTRKVASDFRDSKNDLKSLGLNATATYEFENGLTLKGISAWRRNELKTLVDLDYTQLDFAQPTLGEGGGEDQDAFSQEIQLLGSAFSDRLTYVVGLYGFSEDIDDTTFGGLSTSTLVAIGGNLGFRTNPNIAAPANTQFGLAVANGLANPADFNGILLPGTTAAGGANVAVSGAMTQTIRKVNNSGYAAYTQGTIGLTDRLSLTLGARLTSEKKRVSNQITAISPGFIGSNVRRAGEQDFAFERSDRFKDISPMANLSFQATDDLMLYTTFARGFKSGGFNGRANAVALTNPVGDEKLTSYEVGFKSSWLDRRLQVNGAGYFSLYQDIQLTIPSGGGGQAQILVLNAGEAEIKGGELEIRALPFASLELGASLGVVNSKYTEFEDPSDAFAEDRRVLATPNYTMNYSAAYTITMGGWGDLRLRTEWAHRGESGTDVVETQELRKGKNGELAAQITWAMADGRTELMLFGANLLDREYIVNGVSLASSLGHAYRFYNSPRTYGVEIRRSF